ncbi:MAG: vWA domain-containing protein [Myxococcota bacterium]|nr:vWA domain-containing protein [Myxococcota bacterium]
MALAVWLLTLSLFGCSKDTRTPIGAGEDLPMHTVPGHTFRISDEVREENAQLQVDVLTDTRSCNMDGVDRVEDCLPYLDRASGQVRLSVRFTLAGGTVPLPLTRDHLAVFHDGFEVGTNADSRVEVVPHDPLDTPQLFILVIDGSGSMLEDDGKKLTRIERVRKALQDKAVVDRFLPPGGENGVVLLNFSSDDPQPVGPKLGIIKGPRHYDKVVDRLQPLRGYTHLYQAVRYATGPLLDEPDIRRFLEKNQAQPVVVVLTDGFNNEAASDTCADNARRLSDLLEHLQGVRDLSLRDPETVPLVYTVGLGDGLPGLDTQLRGVQAGKTKVSASDLCGRYADRRIDGQLERDGIDRVSLEWVARHGGGFAYVSRGSKGLGRAFQDAAATRYRWFEVRYQVDPAYLRRRFDTKIRLTAFAQGESEVTLEPSAWLDPPTGELSRRSDLAGWVEPVPYRSSAGVVMTVLGLLVSATFLGAALFNISRVASGRRKPRSGPKG